MRIILRQIDNKKLNTTDKDNSLSFVIDVICFVSAVQ